MKQPIQARIQFFSQRTLPILCSALFLVSCRSAAASSQGGAPKGSTASPSSPATTTVTSAAENPSETSPPSTSPASSNPPSSSLTSAPMNLTMPAHTLKLNISIQEKKANFVVRDAQVLVDKPYTESFIQFPAIEAGDPDVQKNLQESIDSLYAAQFQDWEKLSQESAAALKSKDYFGKIMHSLTTLNQDDETFYLFNKVLYGLYCSEYSAPLYFGRCIDRHSGKVLNFEESLQRLGLKRSELVAMANQYSLQEKLDTQGRVIKGEDMTGERVFFSEGRILMLLPVYNEFWGRVTDSLYDLGPLRP